MRTPMPRQATGCGNSVLELIYSVLIVLVCIICNRQQSVTQRLQQHSTFNTSSAQYAAVLNLHCTNPPVVTL